MKDLPLGFKYSGINVGIKERDLDLALVVSDVECDVAAVFTRNDLKAAPVQISLECLNKTNFRAKAILANSGNANAATGKTGVNYALSMQKNLAGELKTKKEAVLLASTGLIGVQMPGDIDMTRLKELVRGVGTSVQHREKAARAILTTDTKTKTASFTSNGFSIWAFAKGAAMLEPSLATMLCFIMTDAEVNRNVFQKLLYKAVKNSFNRITVDGSMSTNDTVYALANGLSGVRPSGSLLFSGLESVTNSLATAMVDDAEGATKLVRIKVIEARTLNEAEKVARKIANSQLVKCSFYGSDPYWGRILSEIGSLELNIDFSKVQVSYQGVTVFNGFKKTDYDPTVLKKLMLKRELEIVCSLGRGDQSFDILTSDLTHAYVDENMRTS